MPLLGTRGAASARGFGFGAGARITNFWIGVYGNFSSGSESAYGVKASSNGDVYLAGSLTSGTFVPYLSTFGPTGALSSGTFYSGYNGPSSVNGLAIDSSNNLYMVSASAPSGLGYGIATVKYNSSRAIQWQRILLGSSEGSACAVSSSGVFSVGVNYSSGYLGQTVLYSPSTGALIWQNALTPPASNEIVWGYGAAADSSGNFYGAFQYDPGTGRAVLVKYDASGNFLWGRDLLSSGGLSRPGGAAVEPSGNNVYIVGISGIAGKSSPFIVKYNSSGTLQWQRYLAPVGSYGQFLGVVVDSSNNVYACGNDQDDMILVKYNSSGTLQWQRKLTPPATRLVYARDIAINPSTGAILVSGYTTAYGGDTSAFLSAFPSDGSSTGTYSVNGYSFTYAASSMTAATSSLSDSATVLTSGATGWTNTTTSLLPNNLTSFNYYYTNI